MDFSYQMTGGIGLGGCASHKASTFFVVKYAPGTTVYLAYKATKGILERVTIRTVKLVSNAATNFRPVPLYVDSLNALYNEYDLCPEAEAISLATDFCLDRIADIREVLATCPF